MASGRGSESRRHGISIPRVVFTVLVVGCTADADPTAPLPEMIAAGRSAWAAECAPCHTARDGFDIARFGFADADIVRRALGHVDESTAHQIVAFIRSLDITPTVPASAPFQPGGDTVADDAIFWRTVFGTDGWPAGLTPGQLNAIVVRTLRVPLRMPLWSVEGADTDWLSNVRLAPELLDHAGGGLRDALESFHVAPSTARLADALAHFRAASEGTPSSMCAGQPGGEQRARDCFEARRWMSTLTAVHILRDGNSAGFDDDILDLWWDTGKAAQSVYFLEGGHPLDMVSGWLYLAYSFKPTRFANRGGYLEQFLQLSGHLRMAAFAALRRLVATEPIHEAEPAQRFADAYIAEARGPAELRAEIVTFAFEFLLERLPLDDALDDEGRAEAVVLVEQMYHDVAGLAPAHLGSGRLETIADLRDRLLAAI